MLLLIIINDGFWQQIIDKYLINPVNNIIFLTVSVNLFTAAAKKKQKTVGGIGFVNFPLHNFGKICLCLVLHDFKWCRLVAGEASASTMWDNNAWVYFYDNTTEGEPPFLIQDFVHALQPHARFIVMLRDPVERWGDPSLRCNWL